MKRTKKLTVLLTVLALVCTAAFAARKLNPETASDDSEQTSVLSLDTDAITAISWTYSGKTVNLSRSGDSWADADDASCPLDQTYPENMLTLLADIKSEKTLESPEDQSEYGLDDPQLEIKVSAGETRDIKIGSESSMGDEYYMSDGDGKIYLVDSTLLTGFSYGINDIVKTESIPDMEDVQDLEIVNGSRTTSIIYKENSGLSYSDKYLWFARDKSGYTALSTSSVQTLADAVTGLSWSSCADYSADASELKSYGLDEPSATVTVKYTESDTETESETDQETETESSAQTKTAKEEKTFNLELGKYTDSGCYARIAGSKMVYIIDSDTADKIITATEESLLPTEAISMDWDNVTGFDVTLDGKTYKFTKGTALVTEADTETETQTQSETEAALYDESSDTDTAGSAQTETYETNEDGQKIKNIYKINGSAQVNASSVQSILDELNALSSAGTADNVQNDRDEVISFTFHQNSEKWPDVTLSFNEYDSSNYLVTLNGKTSMLTGKSAVDTIKSALANLAGS